MAFDLLFAKENTDRRDDGSLMDDLRLDVLLRAMAGDDQRTAEACRQVLLQPLTGAEMIAARRDVRMDIAAHTRLFGGLLAAAREAVNGAARYAEFQKPRYDRVIPNQKKLLTEIKIARLYLKYLRRMHASVTGEAGAFHAGAVKEFITIVTTRFSAENITRMEARLDVLDSLRLSDDLTLSASVGMGLKPANVTLNCLAEPAPDRRQRLKEAGTPIKLSGTTLIRNAEDVIQSAVLPLLQAVARFNKSTREFLEKLSFQLGFYLGCVRLRKRLQALGVPLCEPRIMPASGGIEGGGLRSAALALQEKSTPEGNDIRFGDKRLLLITGVNQGGKTTFLRSVGLAQLMAQCGMFVTAEVYSCPLYDGIYTHFPSDEDAGRSMGLLDVELKKLSGIVDRIRPRSLLLLNETFQTTMPLDAKYLAELTVQALLDSGVTVLFVTHLYAYAAAQYLSRRKDALFLRAERESGKTAYVLREGEPYASASGSALFEEVMGG